MAAATTEELLADLNPEQRAAVLHDGGPLLVVAGAGTGKTQTLVARLARLVSEGADPRRVLLLTFSRRAAAEMERRAARLLQRALGLPPHLRAPQLPWSGTFHSVAARLLREQAVGIGLAADFAVIDRADAEELLASVRTRLGLHRTAQRFPLAPTCLAIASRKVNTGEPLAETLQRHFPWCKPWRDELARLFTAFAQAKHAQQLLDYDDLLLYWQLMMDEPALAAGVRGRFDHVLVDEMQDLNRLQTRIVHALSPDGRGVTAVGDDAQAIYGFRGADVEHMLGFPGRYTPPARVAVLDRNYRSTGAILDAANAVIAPAQRAFAKRLWTARGPSQRPRLIGVADEAAQAGGVADAVLELREQGVRLRRQAVLFRSGSHSAALELELVARRIPFVKYGGLRFLEAAHVKHLLALLRWTHNLRARLAGARVVRLVGGIGPAAVERLLDALDAATDPAAALRAWQPPPRAAHDWSDFMRTCEALLPSGLRWPCDMQHAVEWLCAQLPRLFDDAHVRTGDLRQLAGLATAQPSRERFLTDITLEPPDATSAEAGPPQRDEDHLVLSTIHSAKGQEWDAVHVLNVVDGCLPADMACSSAGELEEERRLLYVAMTRARERLSLWVPLRFHVTQQRAWGAAHVYASRSRFIADAMLPWFDVAMAACDEAAGASAAGGAGSVDLAGRARAIWQAPD